MKNLKNDVLDYVEKNIGNFHEGRLSSLNKLKLDNVLKRKNIYLFRAKNLLTAQDIVKGITDAHLSSHEETVFGSWLEGLVRYINGKVYGGFKSSSEGIDLEFDKEGVRYIVDIKSGPNWGNSSQINKMIDNFNRAKRTLHTNNSKIHVVAVNGCCYGRDKKPLKKRDYYKYCGQDFWGFISGDEHLYLDVIEPLGYKAKEKNDEFNAAYGKALNRFTRDFMDDFCAKDGDILWEKLLAFNSSANPLNA